MSVKGKERVELNVQSVISEGEISFGSEEYGVISLGVLERSSVLCVEANERNGEDFTYFLVDEKNMHEYEKGMVLDPLFYGMDEPGYVENITIPSTDEYYLIFTPSNPVGKKDILYMVKRAHVMHEAPRSR